MALRSLRTICHSVSAPWLYVWLCIAVISVNVNAATLNVTSTADSGAGSLRNQIAAAAANDTVTFTGAGIGTITLVSPITISQGVFVTGPNNGTVTITGNNANQLFSITTTGAVTISGVTLQNGRATDKGGAIINRGSLSLDRVALKNSAAADGGGAIYNVSISAGTGQLSITNSELSGNSVTGASGIGGGAILSDSTTGTAAAVTITNTTISGNTANANGDGMAGGGIYFANGSLRLISSTVAGNTVGTAGANIHQASVANTSLSIANSIIANGSVTAAGAPAADGDIFQAATATISSAGYNIVRNRSGATGYSTTDAADLTDPVIGALGNNGGATATMALNTGSPAIGLVPAASCVDAQAAALTRDQRGRARQAPTITVCDAGAFETAKIVISPALPGGTVGAAYTQSLTAVGGATPYSFAVTAGTFPNGLNLALNGDITGTASAAGTFGFTITATDSTLATATRVYSVIIAKAAQAITFGAAPTVVVGGNGTVAASGGAGTGAISYSTASTTCSVVAATGVVTGISVGACAINAVKATDANYLAAPQITQNITIGQGSQTLSFGAAPTVVVSGTGTVAASGGAGTGAITYSTASANCSVAAATGVVTGTSAGACAIDAVKAADANYLAAPQITQNLNIGKGSQAIAFGTAPNVAVGGNGTAVATGGAGTGAISYSTTSPACTVNAASGLVTGVTAATCAIDAVKATDANYLASPQVTQTITIGKAAQAIVFGAVPTVIVGGTGTVSASGGAGTGAITYSTASATCTVIAATGVVSGVAGGACAIDAVKATDANYAASPQITQNLTIGQATQAITFGAAPTVVAGGTGTVIASGGAGTGAVSYTTASTTCSVGAATGIVTGISVGACIINAVKAADVSYFAAPQVSQSLTIGQGSQTLVFGAVPAVSVGGNGTVTVTGGNGVGALSFSTISATCSVVANTGVVAGISTGACIIRADKAGDPNFTAAAQVSQSITVGVGAQNITGFTPATTASVSITPVTLSATGGASGNAVTFSTMSAPAICTVAAGAVTYTGLGSCTLRASQSGNANYAVAPNVDVVVNVGLGVQVINFPAQSAAEREFEANSIFAISPPATGGSSGNPIVYSSTSIAVCTVAGTVVTMRSTGECVIVANQAGNANYAPAAAAMRSVVISLTRPIVTASIVGAVNGSVSPTGEITVMRGTVLDFAIIANPRYKAVVAGSCNGRIITSAALTPQGAGTNTYRTEAIGGDCNVLVSFVAMQPVLTISGRAAVTLPNTTPVATYSEVASPAVFTASLTDAVALLNIGGSLVDTSGNPVFIAFQADGVVIAGCEARPINSVIVNDLASQKAVCTTSALSLGAHVITASFAGSTFNFPATTSAAVTPSQALTHVVIGVGAPPPVVVVVPPPVVVPPGSSTLPNVPVNLPPITLILRPMSAPSAISQSAADPAAANGSVSPNGVGGVLEVAANAAVNLAITANPRYLARVTGTCSGSIITSRSLVPQGAGANTYRTEPVVQECTVIITFTPAVPTVTVSGDSSATLPNTTPASTSSIVDQTTTFTATMRQAIGVVGLNRTSPSTVYISFYADGLPIVGCEQQMLTQAFGNEESFHQATCSTAGLSLGTHDITVSFSGDTFNFPAITDSNRIPSPVLMHTVRTAP